MALGGRPKEEGGHRAWKLSFNKLTTEGCEKIQKGSGNISKWIEKQLKPEIENLDPGEASVEIWRYETYLNQRISQALIEDKPGKAKALTSILVALKDFRNLCGLSPLDPKLLSTETASLWKKQAFEDLIKIRNAVINKDPDDLVRVPRATLLCIETYPKLTEKMSSEMTVLENQMKWAYNFPGYILRDPYFGIVKPRQRLKAIANATVPKILKKAFVILQEK